MAKRKLPNENGRQVLSLTARVVESFRGTWSPMPESFSDPGVAMDFIATIDPAYGPTVVRAVAEADEFSDVVGDWLCESGAAGRRLGHLDWHTASVNAMMGRTSASWADGMETIDAWETCREPEILIRAASQRRGLTRLVVKAAAACARRAIDSGGGDAFFRGALDDLTAWCDFRIDIGDAARKRSRMALRHDRRADLAMSLAMQSAMDAVDSATSQTRAGREAHAAQACLVAIDSIRGSVGRANVAVVEAAISDLASLVRESIPTLSVLRAACHERGSA